MVGVTLPNSIQFTGPPEDKQMEQLNAGLLMLQALIYGTCGGHANPKLSKQKTDSGILAELEPAHKSVCSFLGTGILPSGDASNRLERLVRPEIVRELFSEISRQSVHYLTHLNPNEKDHYSNVATQLPRILEADESSMLQLVNSIVQMDNGAEVGGFRV